MKPTQPGYFDREECRPFYHRGGDNGILLVHGFTGSAAHMRPLADELARRGRTVRTINLPGHAQTEEDMGRSGHGRSFPRGGAPFFCALPPIPSSRPALHLPCSVV